MNFSLTITGLATMVLVLFLEKTGIPVIPEEAEIAVTTIVKLLSAVMIWYGRFRQGDINPFGVKKQ